jgi:hypothetical protein
MLHHSLITLDNVDRYPAGIQAKELALLLAQTAWGELIIQPALEKLRGLFTEKPILRIIDSQLQDEQRHESLYWRQIQALDEGFPRHDIPLYYRQLLELVQNRESPQELLAILHVCLESFAMGAFIYRRSVCLSAEILALDALVEEDEKRHLDFAPLLAACARETHGPVSREQLTLLVREVHQIFEADGIVVQLQKRLGFEGEANRTAVESYRDTCNRVWLQQFKRFMRASYGKVGS